MTGEKLARIRKCGECQFQRNAPANVWKWPRCIYGGDEIELDEEFMEGGDCPGKYWIGLEPIDLEANKKLMTEMQQDQLRTFLKPIVIEFLAKIDDKNKADTLVKAVEKGLPDFLALELNNERIIQNSHRGSEA